MDSGYYDGSYSPSYKILTFPASYANHHAFCQCPCNPTYQTTPPDPTAVLPTQSEYVWDIQDSLRQTSASLPMIPFIGPMSPWASEDDCSLASAQPIGFYPIQSQHTCPSCAEMPIWTSAPDAAGVIEDEEDSLAHNDLATRKLMPQETYKAARKQKKFGGSQAIEFYVYGEKGIRLSDALGKNWAGLEGRDGRTLFEDDRAQIMIRLHPVGCPSWKSKVYAMDHTVRRQPITRARLAYDVARNVKKFLEREKAEGHGDHSQCSWKDASLGNMYLTRLVRVSNASWQPEIFVGQPSATATRPASLPPV